MRGLYSSKTKIRHEIFTEIARMAYEDGDCRQMEQLPYKIVPGEVASYRESIFLERAVVGERLRVALGLSLRKISEHSLISEGVENSLVEEKYYEPPLINIIKFACHACPENRVIVTEGCQGCLEHPCKEVCPKGAISMVNGKSHIDPEKCIKCGRCVEACPYNAIIQQERPCAKACGMNAIHDKGQIFQTILAMKTGTPVYAIVAPAVAGQFGPDMKPEKIRPAFQALGFEDVIEVAVGADLCTIEEAKDFMKEVPEELPFMATSCCPAWSMMAKKLFPEQAKCISMALTPMVLTARLIKQQNPDCKIVFVGPCAAKKLEASRKTIRSYVDFVLTFEELHGMFDAKGVDFKKLPDGEPLMQASADGRGFAASGGVASAVVNAIRRMEPNREVKVVSAEGLANCKKMLQLAKAGKYNGYLLEGMACPGGCIAGAGTIQPIKKTAASLEQMKKQAPFEESMDTVYDAMLPILEKL